MSADQIAEIAPVLREAQSGGPDWCATFVLSDDADAWVQYADGVVNAAYPFDVAPDNVLTSLGSAELEGWEPGQYLTVRLALAEVRPIADWIDRYFLGVLRVSEDYSLDVSLERL